MTATFEDATGKTIGTIVSVGGVTAGDRAQVTGLLSRTATAAVPTGTRQVVVTVTMTRREGANNDGYADDLLMVLNGV